MGARDDVHISGHIEVLLAILVKQSQHKHLQLLAVDPSVWGTMKDAAKCDKRCEWQNSASQENAERILRYWVSLVARLFQSATSFVLASRALSTFMCASDDPLLAHEEERMRLLLRGNSRGCGSAKSRSTSIQRVYVASPHA